MQDTTIFHGGNMTNEDIIKLAIKGGQHSTLGYKKRFSICDCITIKTLDCYTAMGAGLELFLNRFNAGEKFVMPYAKTLPPSQLKMMRPVAYKIPNKIDTFLWSPLHEATSGYYDLNDNIKYSFRLKGGYLVRFGVAKKIERPTDKELKEQIVEMDKKINQMWGPNVKKIMICYESSRAQDKIIERRLAEFTKTTKDLLKWPVVQMELTDLDVKEPRSFVGPDENGVIWNGWEHYSNKAYDIMNRKIQEIEEQGEHNGLVE